MSSNRQSDRIGDPVSAAIWDILMKRMIRRLKTLFSRPTEITVADQPTKRLNVKSDDITEDNLESGKNDLTPDIYTAERNIVPVRFRPRARLIPTLSAILTNFR